MEKKCFKCGKKKPLLEFYKHKKMKDGHLNKCKSCSKEDSSAHRESNIESIRAYDRKRGQTLARKEARKAYQARMKQDFPEEWRKSRYEACKRNREKNHEKYIANSRLRYAVKTGKIKKKPCEICGEKKSEAHHPDYNKPLSVVWLCDFHHKEEHKKIRENARAT